MTVENVTNATAGAAITSPLWLSSFHTVSAFAAEILPFLGIAWIVIQMAFKFYDRFWSGR